MESSMPKRVISLVIIILSGVFFIAGLAAMLTVWIGNPRLTENVLTRIQVIDQDLASTQSDLEASRITLQSAQEQIDLIQAVVTSVGIDSEENTRKLSEIIQSVDDTFSPLIEKVAGGVGTLSNAFIALKDIVEKLNALPLISIEIPGADKLEELSLSITDQQAQIILLKEKMQQLSKLTQETVKTLSTNYADLESTIINLNDVVSRAEASIIDYRAQLADLSVTFPLWIDRISVYLTIFLIWFTISQVGLFLLAWPFYTGSDPLARWR